METNSQGKSRARNATSPACRNMRRWATGRRLRAQAHRRHRPVPDHAAARRAARGGGRRGRRRILHRHLDGGVDRPPHRLDCYQGRPIGSSLCPGDATSSTPSSPIRLDLFEEGSIANLLTSLIGNVFGFKAAASAAAGGHALPLAYVKTSDGPPHGIVCRARPARQIRPAAAGLHHQAQARPVGQELRPRGL